eukprot:Em0004g1031a
MFLSCSTATHHPTAEFSGSLSMEETVETEEEHLSQDRDLDAKDIAGSKTYLVYESSLLRLMRKCYVWVKLLS